jgi:hypothetical protein
MHAEVAALVSVDWANVWRDGLALTSVSFLCEVRNQIVKHRSALSVVEHLEE